MKTFPTMTFASLGLGLLSLAAPLAAQVTYSISNTKTKSYGDSDAGVYAYATANASGYYVRSYVPAQVSGRYGLAAYWNTLLTANAYGRVYADLRFLGSSKRAGDFRLNISASSNWKSYSAFGLGSSTFCNSGGTAYLKIGDSVIWNSGFGTTFGGRRSLRLRVMVPSLVVPLGGGLVLLNGNVYANIRAAMDATLDPCNTFAQLNGEAAVSGDASASATVISVLAFANLSASFYANEQKIDANALTIRPSSAAPHTWRSGNLLFSSGSMRGLLHLSSILFPFIPVSTTLADWSKAATNETLL